MKMIDDYKAKKKNFKFTSMKKIPLCRRDGTVRSHALVDACDYEYLIQWKWYLFTGSEGRFYACRKTSSKGGALRRDIFMHNEILKVKIGHIPDHRDGNGLNNRRYNLRYATTSQNGGNRKPNKRGTSKYKGVSWNTQRQKWRAVIKVEGKLIFLGYFDVEGDAAHAYNKAATKYFGEFALLNGVL